MGIAKNTLVVFFSKGLIAFLGLLASAVIARALGPEGLGTYEMFFALVGIATGLGGLGIGSATLYFIAKNKAGARAVLSNALIFGVLWGLVLAGMLFLLFSVFPGIVSVSLRAYSPFLFLLLPLVLLHTYLLPFFLARREVLSWVFFSAFFNFMVLFGIGTAIIFLGQGVLGAIVAVTLSAAVSFLLVIRALPLSPLSEVRFQAALFVKEFWFGLRSYLGDVFSVASLKLNLFIAGIFFTTAQTGYYAVILNASSVLFFIPFAFQQVLRPLWSAENGKAVDVRTAALARQFLFWGIAASPLFFAASALLAFLFYGGEFIRSLMPLALFLPGLVFLTFAGVFFHNFFGRGKPHIASLIALVALGTNVMASAFFIPAFGLAGAATAATLSYGLAAFLAALLFSKLAPYPFGQCLLIRPSDFKTLRSRIRLFLTTGKLMSNAQKLTPEKLAEYYEQKAQVDAHAIMHATFTSPSLFKRMLYATREDMVLSFLGLRPGERVLDAGCGVGYYTKKMAQITPRVVALDISTGYLEKAKSQNPYPVEAYLASPVEKLPLKDNSFDAVLFTDVIEHVIDPEAVLAEIRRVLKPGGRLVVTTPSRSSYLNFLYHLRVKLAGNVFEQDHIREFSRGELLKLVKRTFSVKHFQHVNYFPVFLPHFFVERVGFKRIKRYVQRLERFLNRIPAIRSAGVSMVVQAQKK